MSNSIEEAVAAFSNGLPVCLFDSEKREGETDLLFSAEHATPATMRQLRQDCGGLLFLAIGHEVGERFGLPFLQDLHTHKELVKQFGYIVLFSAVFPLASFMSYISNGIQIRSQITNLKYQRRFKAEVSNGIGSWLGRLETLSNLSIIFNCASIYFTSHVYQGLFVAELERKRSADGIFPISGDGWALLDFFSFVVALEHGLLVLKMIIEMLIDF